MKALPQPKLRRRSTQKENRQLELCFPSRLRSVHFLSRTEEWATPPGVFEELSREFSFTLDPCSTHENAKCVLHYTKADDGLAQDWANHTVFMNPPYGRAIKHWMRKAYESSQNGALVVCLVPARTDTQWWHQFAVRGDIRFLRGRLRFGQATSSAPFPSAVVVFSRVAPSK